MIRNTLRKTLCTTVALLFLSMYFSMYLFAEDIFITWKWASAEEGITHFRYQLNGEEEDGWQVIEAGVNSLKTGPLDRLKNHILYIQQSRDGITWGQTWFGVYEPESVEPDPGSAGEHNEPIQSTRVSADSRYELELSFGLGGPAGLDRSNMYADLSGIIFPSISLDFTVNNLVTFLSGIGMGIQTGLGFTIYSPQSSRVQFLDIHALAAWHYALENRLSFKAGIGTTVMAPYANLSGNTISFFDPANINIFYGLTGSFSVTYPLNSFLTLGLQTRGSLMFSDTFDPYEVHGFASLVLGYQIKPRIADS